MKPVTTFLLLQALFACTLVSATIPRPDADTIRRIDRLEFKSCPGCRLNYQGNLRKFLHENVKEGKVPGVTVEFIQSHRPELHYIDAEGNTIGGVSIDRRGIHEIYELLGELGF